jgi:predicted nucleotide-binding protein (sugar kinase/HSP70/actin superfamily)
MENLMDELADNTKKITEKIKEELKNTFNAKVDVELNIEEAWRQLHKLRAELQGLKDTDYLGNINLQMRQFQEYLRTNPNSTLPGGSLEILT